MRISNLMSITFVVFLTLLLSQLSSITSNPLPVYIIELEEACTPVPDGDSPLYLKSEELRFYIDENVQVLCNFTICNPTDTQINQTIIFPINERVYSEGTRYEQGYYGYKILNLCVSLNNSEVPYKECEYDQKTAISFEVSVPPNNDLIIQLVYETFYFQNYEGNCWLNYITTTGREWNHSINHAYFKFFFNNTDVIKMPEGGDFTDQTDDYFITTIERTNWTPSKDICIQWRKLVTHDENNEDNYYEYNDDLENNKDNKDDIENDVDENYSGYQIPNIEIFIFLFIISIICLLLLIWFKTHKKNNH